MHLSLPTPVTLLFILFPIRALCFCAVDHLPGLRCVWVSAGFPACLILAGKCLLSRSHASLSLRAPGVAGESSAVRGAGWGL